MTHDLPVVDIGALLDPIAPVEAIAPVAREIDRACRDIGFFGIVGHGVEPLLQDDLERLAHEFFARPEADKAFIAMHRGGRAWRGWFPLGGELTAGRPDGKEGLYFGTELDGDHPRVRSGTALHGPNQFPLAPADLADTVLRWIAEMRRVAEAVMRGLAAALGLPPGWFAEHLTSEPTELFRIFRYPPTANVDGADWGVAEHTDYGLLTILAQDDLGGLEVRRADGGWITVEPRPGMFMCNLGDMLERLTNGWYVSTPHRVRNTAGRDRLSFPYFFDPSWDATVPVLPLAAERASARSADDRWDGADVRAWEGTYGDYLTAKVARVFPDLFEATSTTR